MEGLAVELDEGQYIFVLGLRLQILQSSILILILFLIHEANHLEEICEIGKL
jgi:hypothetical protein